MKDSLPSFVVALVAVVALAPRAPEASEIPEHFLPFEALVGGAWLGTFPDGKLTDRQVFEWIYDGKFLRNTHAVLGAGGKAVYEGETIYAWDHAKERVAWWYFNTTGGTWTSTSLFHDGTDWKPRFEMTFERE